MMIYWYTWYEVQYVTPRTVLLSLYTVPPQYYKTLRWEKKIARQLTVTGLQFKLRKNSKTKTELERKGSAEMWEQLIITLL